jgi:hypothetical protein
MDIALLLKIQGCQIVGFSEGSACLLLLILPEQICCSYQDPDALHCVINVLEASSCCRIIDEAFSRLPEAKAFRGASFGT